jgi:multiple sugar transport system substrate-binding protein
LLSAAATPASSAALRAREVQPDAAVTVVVAEGYPNFSICGFPFFVSGETPDWHLLAHRTLQELEVCRSGAAWLTNRTRPRALTERREFLCNEWRTTPGKGDSMMRDSPGNGAVGSFGRRIDRRDFLKAAGVTGVLLSSSGLLAACGGGSTAGKAAGGTGTLKPPDTSKDFSGEEALVFNSWTYEVNFVKENVARFEQQNKEKVNYEVISGDFPAIMETKHTNKAPLDMSYVLDTNHPRWARAGWIHDYEGWWDVDKAKADMYDSVKNVLTIDGKLYGIPYFTADSGIIATNQDILDKVGITRSQYPKNWKQLYDQIRQVKKAGAADTPYLPKWINEWFGIPLGIYEEMINQNLELVDDKGVPIFDGTTEHVRVLEDGKKAWDEGLIPQSVLTMNETDQIDGFATGQYAMSQQQIYDLEVFNRPERSKIAGKAFFVPPGDTYWGHLQVGMYAVANRGRTGERLARSFRLAGWFGYKDNEGQFYVTKRWANIRALNSGYKAVLDDPEVIASYKKWMPDSDTMIPDMKKSMDIVKPLKMTKEFWFTEWSTKAREVYPNVMLGKITAKDAMKQLRDEANKLQDKYKNIK